MNRVLNTKVEQKEGKLETLCLKRLFTTFIFDSKILFLFVQDFLRKHLADEKYKQIVSNRKSRKISIIYAGSPVYDDRQPGYEVGKVLVTIIRMYNNSYVMIEHNFIDILPTNRVINVKE